MTQRFILVGTGGFGLAWCKAFFPPNIDDGHAEVVAAVDINESALENAKEYLGLPPDRCYTDLATALQANEADCCAVVVPPQHHEAVITAALDHGLHVLSEKPIADTLSAAQRIARRVHQSGRKMAVTMSHRFDQDKTTFRAILRSGALGPIDYLVMRFTCDCRAYGSWGASRHEMLDPTLVEGAVHHLDILADLAGAPCESMYAQSWNPRWGDYKGDSQAIVQLRFENGVRALYEAAKTNAVGLNGWGKEYIRAECQNGTLILDKRHIELFSHQPGKSWVEVSEGEGEPIELLQQPKWSNAWLIEKFVDWIQGGPPMETHVDANLRSVELVSAAVESSRHDTSIDMQTYLDRTAKGEARAYAPL